MTRFILKRYTCCASKKTKMLVKNKIKIDRHLQGFVLGTPTSISKLIEVFDDLSIESQIKILDFLEEPGIPEKIIDKALLSKISFIRYKAAKTVSLNEENIKTIEKYENEKILHVSNMRCIRNHIPRASDYHKHIQNHRYHHTALKN